MKTREEIGEELVRLAELIKKGGDQSKLFPALVALQWVYHIHPAKPVKPSDLFSNQEN